MALLEQTGVKMLSSGAPKNIHEEEALRVRQTLSWRPLGHPEAGSSLSQNGRGGQEVIVMGWWVPLPK